MWMSIPLDKDLLCMLDIARSCVGSLVCQPGDQYEGEDGRSRSKSVLLCCKRFQGPVKNINRMHYCQSLFILPHPTQCTFQFVLANGCVHYLYQKIGKSPIFLDCYTKNILYQNSFRIWKCLSYLWSKINFLFMLEI